VLALLIKSKKNASTSQNRQHYSLQSESTLCNTANTVGGNAAIGLHCQSAEMNAAYTSGKAEFYVLVNQPLGKPTLGAPEASGKATNSYIPKSSRASSWPEMENKTTYKPNAVICYCFLNLCNTCFYCLL
jgi:hypothetical protein